MFLYGPLAGVITAFVRSLLHLFLTGLAPQNMVGDFASFLASSIFTLPIFISLVKEKYPYKSDSGLSKWDLSLDNFHEYCELFCHYTHLLTIIWCDHTTILGTSLASYVAIGIVPFNLIKGLLVSGVFLVLHAKLLPWLSKTTYYSEKTPLTK